MQCREYKYMTTVLEVPVDLEVSLLQIAEARLLCYYSIRSTIVTIEHKHVSQAVKFTTKSPSGRT